MAGEYIEFNNNSQPAINDTNLNRLQQLIKQDIQGAVSGDTLPIGVIVPYGSNTIPDNWLLCDGSAVSRTTYQELFNTIGTTYGAGDGFTTFNLPDLQGKVVVGKDDNDTDFDTLGEIGGEKTHTLTTQEIPSHNHIISRAWGGNGFAIPYDDPVNGWRLSSEGNTVAANTQNTGEGQAHNILQPYQVQNYIIKAFQSSGVVAQVVNTKTTSDEDVYSCNYINNLQPIVLYSNDSGTTGDITLSDNAENYDHLIVYWKTTYNLSRKGVSIAPNQTHWSLFTFDIDANTYQTIYQNFTRYYIDGTSFNVASAKDYQNANNNVFYITKIVGCKF